MTFRNMIVAPNAIVFPPMLESGTKSNNVLDKPAADLPCTRHHLLAPHLVYP